MPLNEGPGPCRPSHQLSVRPTRAVVELGALGDVIHTALNAAHHANRHGDPEDRIAVALPGLRRRRGIARPGHEVVLFGSQVALEAWSGLDGVRTLLRRGMVEELDIAEAWAEPGEPGTAYVRDRAADRLGPSRMRRLRARAERRGETPPDLSGGRPDPTALALHYGSAVVLVREMDAPVAEGSVRVGTFGFSSPGAPAALPIRPDHAPVWENDAG